MTDDASQPMSDEQAAMHRKSAVDLFNHTWTLMMKASRTVEEDSQMVHAAHASAWHWRQVGTPVNFARSEWQCSRVYALLFQSEASRRHAQRCLDLCHEHAIGGFDEAFALEALARAAAVAGDTETYQRYQRDAAAAGEKLEKEEDRTYFFCELNGIPEWIAQSNMQ